MFRFSVSAVIPSRVPSFFAKLQALIPYKGVPYKGVPYKGVPHKGVPHKGDPYKGDPYKGDPYYKHV